MYSYENIFIESNIYIIKSTFNKKYEKMKNK